MAPLLDAYHIHVNVHAVYVLSCSCSRSPPVHRTCIQNKSMYIEKDCRLNFINIQGIKMWKNSLVDNSSNVLTFDSHKP